jgi:hypothetical protein
MDATEARGGIAKMSRMRIWHLMVAVLAAAVLFGADRLDNRCTPIPPLVLFVYACGALGYFGARRRGRRGRTGLLWGLLLGPFGVILARSNPIPERFRQRPPDGFCRGR